MSSHRRTRHFWVSIPVGVAVLLTGAHITALSPARAASTSAKNSCGPVPKLVRNDFPAEPLINNTFQPLVPGIQYVLSGFVIGTDGSRHPHVIETTVTDLTKVVDGVRAIVVLDRDFQDGELQESELFFQAQDGMGAVWLLGEYPEEYTKGRLTGAPATWIGGMAGAKPGITMLADPQLGTPAYRQGLAPRVGFEDCATVFQTGQHTCVPTGCYDNVLVTDEFAPNDPSGGHQRKFNAPGIGTVRVTAASGIDPETLELTKAGMLCAADFDRLRGEALKEDGRGYRVARSVYRGTSPAARTLSAQTC
jgi:hypothetical protein